MIKRHLGTIVCVFVALYFLLSPAYALLNFADYASELPLFLRYVAVPGLLGIGFLAVALFARPSLSTTVGIYGLSILAAFFVFEAFLAFRLIPMRLAMLGQVTAAQAETLDQQSIVRGFTLRGLNRFAETKELPTAILSGFPEAQVILCTPDDRVIKYTADRYGFNNPDKVHDTAVDVVLVGDSFVEGFCLPPGEDLTARLRAGGLSAASMGIRGNGPLVELATLGRFGPVIRPRHAVMVFFEGNDWENFENEMREPWLREALSPAADFGTQAEAQAAKDRARVIADRQNSKTVTTFDLLTRTTVFRNFFALQQTFTRLGLIYPKAARKTPEFQETLRRAKALTAGWGGRFTMVYVPRLDRFMGPFASASAFDQLRTMVIDAASAEGIEVVDLWPSLEEHPDAARLYGSDGHFNREGAVYAAEIISRHLKTADMAAEVK